jgi:hypothetical protein
MRKALFVFALLIVCVSLAFPVVHKKKRNTTAGARSSIEGRINGILMKDYKDDPGVTGYFKPEYQYKDINNDGVDEVIVCIPNGSTNSYWKIFNTNPLKKIGDFQGVELQVLKTSHKGYRDLYTFWHGSATQRDTTEYLWNGEKYQEVK